VLSVVATGIALVAAYGQYTVTVVCAVALAAHHDLHGASLTSGMLLMSASLLGRQRLRR
jgi:hypothetical protein